MASLPLPLTVLPLPPPVLVVAARALGRCHARGGGGHRRPEYFAGSLLWLRCTAAAIDRHTGARRRGCHPVQFLGHQGPSPRHGNDHVRGIQTDWQTPGQQSGAARLAALLAGRWRRVGVTGRGVQGLGVALGQHRAHRHIGAVLRGVLARKVAGVGLRAAKLAGRSAFRAGELLGQQATALRERSGQRLNVQGHVWLLRLRLQLMRLRLGLGQAGGNIDVQALQIKEISL